jgi:CO/xanthine dehydrogenase Mo-binding subunit
MPIDWLSRAARGRRSSSAVVRQNADGAGPFGAKGAGEGSLIPVSPAVGNALTRLTGVRFRELPLTPERVWRALRARR